ncbi:response regulator [Geobacter sulfurreducens]|jgi:signal transduction histidine kinase|uniref:histidine kinase n=1 Tax=Geobacter sulfurreducens (strain ATCC 51573 / DSM 12127 / PCA) TaxID=243231 RepID=Q74E45_GEOSL|nr:response regulator [Geobacter sulfurreducens]AAR34445.2 response receiver histidine kinase [Geobacter sulfurreducens PCA]ADI83956.1 response receiver histidine kinase [Geobacter sulfurreducens KN400]AJY70840.1 histidine kinase [Geobacter sulfurreducens]QVW36345.1 response regulator [Geobacter sulfurreducens]UAC05160.1 response regulator [Geobacter sulfurreducens]
MMTEKNESKGTILIIDDEKVILDLTSIVLRNRGYTVHTASDATSGMAVLEECRPQMVLLDYMMPMVDGLTALKQIRQRYPDTYVIIFTGKGNEELAVELMKAGASDYIVKPFNNQNLVERIENVLRIRDVELRNQELLQERELLLAEIEAWNQELERRVQQKSEALQQAQAEIVQSEKLASLGYLSAGMAHEIRNPLNSISLFAQLLKSTLDDPEKVGYVDKILKEADRIDDIMRKLLDASKRPRFQLSEVRLDRVIEATLEAFRPQISLHGIAVVKEFRRIPPPFQADPAEIEQIFTNLFLNSIHEMNDGGSLTVVLDQDERNMVIRIADTGPGIPREHVAKIFDPFFTTKTSGSGLGLAVVLRIVKTYDGRIDVEKSDESGTVFAIRLPLSGV